MFEFCEHDLAGLLANNNVKLNLGEIKKIMQQLLNGLQYLHNNEVCIDSKVKISGCCASDIS